MAYAGPEKAAFVVQIEADLKNSTEDAAVLKERLKRVKAAGSDEKASEAYFGHLDELRAAEDSPGSE